MLNELDQLHILLSLSAKIRLMFLLLPRRHQRTRSIFSTSICFDTVILNDILIRNCLPNISWSASTWIIITAQRSHDCHVIEYERILGQETTFEHLCVSEMRLEAATV